MNSQRIDPLLRRAQEREDVSARELAERRQALAAQESRLNELRHYAEEYSRPSGSTISPALLHNQLAFREKVDQAVSQQSQVVDRSREQCELERARLLLASRDKQVLDKLAASYRAQEHRAIEQNAQRELDDLGARSHRAGLGASGPATGEDQA